MNTVKTWLTAALLVSTPVLAQPQYCDTTHIRSTKPDSRYDIHPDGTVSDKESGLMWMTCAIGMSGKRCEQGKPTEFTWQAALQFAETFNKQGGFAGHTDWRLPTVKESHTLIDRQCNNPAMNARVFINAPSYRFWTVSPVAATPEFTWGLATDYGYVSPFGRRTLGLLRLVRYQ